MARQPLTHPDGPVVISERTLSALASIRRLKLLPQLYQFVVVARSNYEAVRPLLTQADPAAGGPVDAIPVDPGYARAPGLDWLLVAEDRPNQPLPARVDFPQGCDGAEAATLRLALAIPASEVLLDGPVKERAKLSFIKAEGTLSILVSAYREGHLSAVKPMVKALEALGFGDVLPPRDILDALWTALDDLPTQE